MNEKDVLGLLTLIPAIILIAVLSLTVWSEFTGTTVKEYFQTVFTPNQVAKKEYAKYEIKPNSLTDPNATYNPNFNSPELTQLDADSHTSAMNAFCESQGWKGQAVNGVLTCVAPDEETCTKFSTYPVAPPGTEPSSPSTALNSFNQILTWSNGKCINNIVGNNNLCAFQLWDPKTQSYKVSNQLRGDIDTVRKSLSSVTALPYIGPDVTCDANGLCTSYNYPTCKLTEEYCSAKGMKWSSEDNGDCYIDLAQNIAEVILGTTVTRTIKKQGEDIVNACRTNGPLSIDCINSLNIEQTVKELAVDTVISRYTDGVREFRNKCVSDISLGGKALSECTHATSELFPQYWAQGKAVEMLNGIVSLIPGFPTGLSQDIFTAMLVNGNTIDALFKYGPRAGIAIYRTGEDGVKAINALAGGDLVAFTSYTMDFVKSGAEAALAVQTALNPMIEVGVLAAKAIWKQYGGTALQIATAIGLAIQNGAVALGSFVADTIYRKGVEGLRTVVNQLGIWFGEAGVAFVDALKTVGGAFTQIANDIASAVGSAANDVVCLGGIIC